MLGFGSIDRTIELFKGSIEPPNLIELSSSTELELELERFDLSLVFSDFPKEDLGKDYTIFID